MKRSLIAIIAIFVCSTSFAQFNKHFLPKTLRLDYFHCGTDKSEDFFFKELIEEPFWGGSTTNMVDKVDYGNQMVKMYSLSNDSLLYSQGYCTLFTEWQATIEATKTNKCYPESVILPFPKNPVRIEISSRDRKNKWVKKFEYKVDPSDYMIVKSQPQDQVFDVVYNGAPDKKLDIVLLSEGYTNKDKFKFDCERFAAELLSFEPFKSRAREFNIRGVWRSSVDEGSSMPGEHLWKKTALNSRYYTFDSERYVMIDDLQGVRSMAANAPYDLIYILTDTKKYGGGGVYNFYGISASGNPDFAGKVYVHEFGHLLVGLGDEYVGDANTEQLYSSKVEPWEPNLTSLVDFDKKEWKAMLTKDVKIPTADIDENENKLGVFEGGGYSKTGIYRPWRNCLMRVLNVNEFCPVCTKAINNVMDRYTK